MVRRKIAARLTVGVLLCCCVRGGGAQSDDCADDGLIFDCEQPPPAASPCAADAQRLWVVETSAQARDLAAAVGCSGGSFDVEWRGTVVVDEPIYVVNGTVLTVTGGAVAGAGSGGGDDGDDAVIDGNSATRLFAVVDAALHLSGVTVSSGAGVAGGAVAAAGSALTLDRTSFVGNSATGGSGGAVYASEGSSVSFVGGGTTFADNGAASHGGALHVTGGSEVSWTGEVRFVNNSCGGFGGALAVESSTVVATGNAVFASNSAAGDGGFGGAINAFSGSSVIWSGETTQFQDNSAGGGGGAVAVAWFSEMSWSGPVQFSGNNASVNGGALLAGSSTVSWDGKAEFVGNTAAYGGAINANTGSNLSWSGESFFSSNVVSVHGGAIYLEASSASWTGDTDFFNNTAERYGGAMAVDDSTVVVSTANTTFVSNGALASDSGFGGAVNAFTSSRVILSGEITEFQDNRAGNGGGAMAVAYSSEVSCGGPCRFSGNTARAGGAMTVGFSTVSWSAGVALVGNTAESGGALFIYNGSNVTWTGVTEFSSNEALFDGGAIATPLSGVSFSPLDSTLTVRGATSFANNTSGANGGALALLGGCAADLGSADVVFSGNSADVAGGAVFLSSTGFGPTFSGASFVSNSAQVGGAVSTVGSGNTKDDIGVEASNPTTFDSCRFTGNTATATGGAVESAAGLDAYVGSVFEGNRAGTGGALRLAGTASVDNCSFVENVSDDSGGPAVSNIGFISRMANVSFGGNVFDCEPDTFLDFNVRGGGGDFWLYGMVHSTL